MPIQCNKCGQEISRLRLGAHWPTSIPCKHCRTKHSFAYGHLIGTCFTFALLPACLVPMLVAGNFATVTGQTHSIGPLYLLAHLSTIGLVVLGFCYLQGSLLTRFGRLK